MISESEAAPKNAPGEQSLIIENNTESSRIPILEVAIIIAKHKKWVLGVPLLIAIVTAGITLLMPNWYTATAKILPPQQSQSNAIAILGQLGVLTGGASQALGIKNPSDIFVAILKSRTVADSIIQRFELQTVYKEEYMQDARKALARKVEITAGREGVITIEVDDKSPSRAAGIANAYLEELEKLTLRLAISEAGQRRLFFERLLKQAKDDLTHAEVQLTKYQVNKRILNPQGQASLMIAAAAGLRAQIAAKEVQISSMKSFAAAENADLRRAQEELSGLRAQLEKLGGKGDAEVGDVLLSMGKAPEEGAQYLRKFRDVKYYETLFELLSKQYEIARIDEAKEATLIQALDRAIVPDKKSKPMRSLIVILTGLLAGIVTLAFVIMVEVIKKSSDNPLQNSQFAELRRHLGLQRT